MTSVPAKPVVVRKKAPSRRTQTYANDGVLIITADPFASDQDVDSEEEESLSKIDSEVMYRIVENVLEGFNDDTPKAETIKLDDSDDSINGRSKKRKRFGKYGMMDDTSESARTKEEEEPKQLTELSIKEEEAPVTIVSPTDLKNESMKKQQLTEQQKEDFLLNEHITNQEIEEAELLATQ